MSAFAFALIACVTLSHCDELPETPLVSDKSSAANNILTSGDSKKCLQVAFGYSKQVLLTLRPCGAPQDDEFPRISYYWNYICNIPSVVFKWIKDIKVSFSPSFSYSSYTDNRIFHAPIIITSSDSAAAAALFNAIKPKNGSQHRFI
ncbi:hypothetical protein HDE_13825 [Halotydeus destructor]|nr:hypothetical protein HDE_13825 [Halotydeus destructor]